jgi:hypothetical protein
MRPSLVFRAGAAHVSEQLDNGVLRRARLADGGADRVAFHEGGDDPTAALKGMKFIPTIMLDRSSIGKVGSGTKKARRVR